MKGLFAEILSIEDVEGIMLFASNGQITYQEFSPSVSFDLSDIDWKAFGKAANGIREADLLFKNKRIYLRKTTTGYLMVIMWASAPAAMVRLHIDLILPDINNALI
jgi:hypothetical protein